MDRKKRQEKQPDGGTARPAEDAPRAAAHEDLRVLIGEIRKRDRQTAIARLLVDAYARLDGVDPDVAWLRHRRSIAIMRASAVSKGDLKKTEVSDLVAEIDARIAKG